SDTNIKQNINVFDIANNNILEQNLNNNDIKDGLLVVTDSANNVSNNILKITGNNTKFTGTIIITSPNINTIEFGENSYVKTIKANGDPLKYIFNGYNVING
ncbi:MAG: hypothetical protein IJU54_01135, partial [Alphaproteobacteria bacterium]|nr:hypothetical protein [Alphaproteobacteria bacterium]